MINISTFYCDITPPLGHPLCAGWYPSAQGITDPLSALGIVLISDDESPVVLCASDWAELSNHDHRRWREQLAVAAKTQPDRVAVQCTHPHNAPWPDREAQNLLDEAGYANVIMAGDWCEQGRDCVAESVKVAMGKMRRCSHVATGEAAVEMVASNRRVMGEDGKVWAVRYTRALDPQLRAAPVGVIDPMLKSISFFNNEEKLAVIHYYAVHPTSYDRDGLVTPDFTGLARDQRIREDGSVPHVYFTGCAGNVTAGKYNDGNPANRVLFTQRVHRAMVESEAQMVPERLTGLAWAVEPVQLPPREDLKIDELRKMIASTDTKQVQRSRAAIIMTYIQRQHMPIPVTCLHLNSNVSIVHLPGESFIEYQLYAQELKPDKFVAVASYGDLGTGYITLERSFAEGGYEPTDSFVSGQSESIMRRAIETVLRR